MSLGFGPSLRDCLELHSLRKLLHAAIIQPFMQIFALTDIKCLKPMAAVDNSFDADTGNSHTPSNG